MPYIRKLTQDVIIYDKSKAFNGYTLFAPMSTNDAWLIDMNGNIVHHWQTPYPPAQHGRLLPNGHLLWPQKAKAPKIPVGGVGSEILELDWNGKTVWKHEDDTVNHDIRRLSNGNTMYNAYVRVPDSIATKIQGGVPETEAEGQIWSSCLREVDVNGKIVWEWKMYEHLDPVKDAQCPLCPRSIWGYINSFDVMRDGNIVCTFRFDNAIGIIEKKTGNVLWRWGSNADVGHPHCVSEIENGNFLFFDNGLHRKSIYRGAHELSYSRLLEVNPRTEKIVWEYHDPNVFNFYSSICGGVQRLPNGNTLACESTKGRFFEVTPDKEIVWEYHNPFRVHRSDYWGWTISSCVFQAHRYPTDYPAFHGKELSPDKYLWVLQEDPTKVKARIAAFDRLERLGY